MTKENGKPQIRFAKFKDTWEQRKLGELAEIVGGGTPSTSVNSYWDGDIDWYAPAEIGEQIYLESSQRKITEEGLNKSSAKILPIGTVLFTSRAGIGKTAILLKEGCTNQGFQSIVPNKVKLDSYFIFTRSEELKRYGETVGAGSTFVEVSGKQMANMELMMPKTMLEQQQIGEYFANLDHLITLHQRKYDKLTKVKKSMLEKMFPKNGTNVPEIRFKGFTDAWEQRKLGDIITEYKETVDSDCTLPILTSSKTEGVILQEEHFGRKQQHDITGYNILPRNYCTYRNRSDGVDFTFNINKCCDKGIISKFYPVFSGKNSDVFFLSLVLNNSEEVVREIAYTCTGTGQKVLSFLDLQKMKVRVPNFDEQKEIAAYFESLDHIITLHQRKLEKLKILKKACLEKMFV